MISGKDLWWLINIDMSFLPIITNMIFNFVKIHIWCPTIDVNNCQKQIICWQHHSLEFFLQVLCAPWDIWSFTFLFVHFNFVKCIVHMSEFWFETVYYCLGFFTSALLMFLHGQKDKVWLFGTFMCWQKAQGFCNKFNVLLVTWNDKSVKDFLTIFSYMMVLLILAIYSSTKNPTISDQQHKINKPKHNHP